MGKVYIDSVEAEKMIYFMEKYEAISRNNLTLILQKQLTFK